MFFTVPSCRTLDVTLDLKDPQYPEHNLGSLELSVTLSPKEGDMRDAVSNVGKLIYESLFLLIFLSSCTHLLSSPVKGIISFYLIHTSSVTYRTIGWNNMPDILLAKYKNPGDQR